jgi:hypothetical protein
MLIAMQRHLDMLKCIQPGFFASKCGTDLHVIIYSSEETRVPH